MATKTERSKMAKLLGGRGGRANTAAQQAQRAQAKPGAGRPLAPRCLYADPLFAAADEAPSCNGEVGWVVEDVALSWCRVRSTKVHTLGTRCFYLCQAHAAHLADALPVLPIDHL